MVKGAQRVFFYTGFSNSTANIIMKQKKSLTSWTVSFIQLLQLVSAHRRKGLAVAFSDVGQEINAELV